MEVGPNRVCYSVQPLVNVTLKALLFRGVRGVVFMTPEIHVERNGSGVELRTLDYKNPCSNSVLRC